jgi:DNA-binding response OmpR family regulator
VVVDPDERTRAAVRSAADQPGYEFVAVDDGSDVLERLADRRPVLVAVEVELAEAMNRHYGDRWKAASDLRVGTVVHVMPQPRRTSRRR